MTGSDPSVEGEAVRVEEDCFWQRAGAGLLITVAGRDVGRMGRGCWGRGIYHGVDLAEGEEQRVCGIVVAGVGVGVGDVLIAVVAQDVCEGRPVVAVIIIVVLVVGVVAVDRKPGHLIQGPDLADGLASIQGHLKLLAEG